jgi:colanic acid biosynthesis protein WcaH
MRLDENAFITVVKNAPMVSIDLIIKDQRNNYLLGRRVNEPAKGQYFVPGGVVHKGQTLERAFIDIFTK